MGRVSVLVAALAALVLVAVASVRAGVLEMRQAADRAALLAARERLWRLRARLMERKLRELGLGRLLLRAQAADLGLTGPALPAALARAALRGEEPDR